MDNRLLIAGAIATGAIVLAQQLSDEQRTLFRSLDQEAIALEQGLQVAAENAQKREAMLAQITAVGCKDTDIAISKATVFPGTQPGDCLRKGGTVGMIGTDNRPAIIINEGEESDDLR